MDREKLRTYRPGSVLLICLAGLAVPGLGGCEELKAAQEGLCCSGFDVGADLSGVDFEAGVEFKAFVQAVADFAGTASAMATGVGNACKALAVDLGEAEDAVALGDPADAAEAWCGKALAKIKAEVTAKGSITISVQPPQCNVSVSAQASCEAGCDVNIDCKAELGDISARCEPGQLSGKCEGSCSGSCEGSANLAVACEGTCKGTCEGTCEGTCSNEVGNGGCKGQCSGKCTGECRGSCEVDASASLSCNGQCTGGCDVELKAPKCKVALKPPSAECSGNANCQASCQASASAKAECTPPSVEIAVSGNIDEKVIGSLKLHLPQLFLAAKAQAEMMLKNAEAMLSLSLTLDPGNLSLKAAACLIPVGAAIEVAVGNICASVDSSLSIIGELGAS